MKFVRPSSKNLTVQEAPQGLEDLAVNEDDDKDSEEEPQPA